MQEYAYDYQENEKPSSSKTRKQEILDGLNDQQKLPVLDYKGASMLVACAGSGKSHTVVARAAYMVEDGVSPDDILIFTFTKKAANELKERVLGYLDERGHKITVSTYHSFCVRVLRAYAEVLGWTRGFSIYDAEDSTEVLKNIIKDKNLKPQVVSHMISKWKEHMDTPVTAMSKATEEQERKIAGYYGSYAAILRAQNAFDFDDLIFFVVKLLSEHPEIRKVLNDRYQYIIADEAQDSSKRDLTLISLLGGERKNICLVGDDWQSIYSFRGSDINALFDFVSNNHLKQFMLERNYRSTQTIVDASKGVIQYNTEQFDKEAFSKNEVGDQIWYQSLPSPQAEAEKIATYVKAIVRNPKYSYKDIAILFRLNYLSRKVEDAFLKSSIPYELMSGTSFYERMEVKDILSYLRVLVNPCDIISLKRSLSVPKRGIGDKSLELLFSCDVLVSSDIIGVDTLIQACRQAPLKAKAKQGALNYATILEQLCLELSHGASPKDMVKHVMSLTGYQEYLKQLPKEEYEERMQNIFELEEIAAESHDLIEFLSNMVMNNGEDDDPDSYDKVKMMSIHGSKGLEFPVVILMGANEGTLPHFRSISEGNVEEERRLFYVAMTRAEDNFIITRSKMILINGIPKPTTQSRFINEIDSKFLHVV